MTLNLLIQALEQADLENQPGVVFTLLPEQTIWDSVDELLTTGHKSLVLILVRGLDDAFASITNYSSASSFLSKVLNPTLDSLLYDAAVAAILRHALEWQESTAKEYYDTFESNYRLYLKAVHTSKMFIARTSLEGAVMLPIYRNAKRLLFSAQGLLVNYFPPLPVDPNEIDYVAVRAVQLLGVCYDVSPQEIVAQKIKELSLSPNFEIAAEASYHLGLVKLHQAFQANNYDELRTHLQDAHISLQNAIHLRENRSDAELLTVVIHCFLEILTPGVPTRLPALVKQAEEILIERLLLLGEAASTAEEKAKISLIRLMLHLNEWTERLASPLHWHNITPPMEALAETITAVRHMEVTNRLVESAQEMMPPLVMLPYLRSQFLQVEDMRLRVIDALNDPDWRAEMPASTVEFFQEALALIAEENSLPPKDKAAAEFETFLVAAEKIDSTLSQEGRTLLAQGHNSQTVMMQTIKRLIEHKRLWDEEALLEPARSIYNRLRLELHKVLGWTTGSIKLFFLESALRNIASYFVAVDRLKTSDADFLFAKPDGKGEEATERDLQDHFWINTRTLLKVTKEPSQALPGRPDLLIHFPHGIEFPIEVKHESQDVSPANIKRRFVAQAQHYAASAHQVGFLFVLDITPKDPSESPKSILDNFYLAHREIQDETTPVWVAVFIFPANRYSPSAHTRFAGKKRR
jgi:hypothetical protein